MLCFCDIVDQLLHHVNVLGNSQRLSSRMSILRHFRCTLYSVVLTLLLGQFKANSSCVRELTLNLRLCFISLKIILTCLDSFYNIHLFP